MNKLWLPVLAMAFPCIAATQSSNIAPYPNKAEQYIRESEGRWQIVTAGDLIADPLQAG